MDAQQLIDRCEYTIEYQKQEIDRLRAEVQRLTDLLEGKGLDAHTCLRNIYTSPESSEGNKLKAAAASLPFERPKLMSVAPPLELRAEPSLIDLHARRLERQLQAEAEGRDIEVTDAGVRVLPKPNGGNGQDDSNSD